MLPASCCPVLCLLYSYTTQDSTHKLVLRWMDGWLGLPHINQPRLPLMDQPGLEESSVQAVASQTRRCKHQVWAGERAHWLFVQSTQHQAPRWRLIDIYNSSARKFDAFLVNMGTTCTLAQRHICKPDTHKISLKDIKVSHFKFNFTSFSNTNIVSTTRSPKTQGEAMILNTATIRPTTPLHTNAKSKCLLLEATGVVHIYSPNTLEVEAGE